MSRVEKLEQVAEINQNRMAIYDQLLGAETTGVGSDSGSAATESSSDENAQLIIAAYKNHIDPCVESIRTSIIDGTNLWKDGKHKYII